MLTVVFVTLPQSLVPRPHVPQKRQLVLGVPFITFYEVCKLSTETRLCKGLKNPLLETPQCTEVLGKQVYPRPGLNPELLLVWSENFKPQTFPREVRVPQRRHREPVWSPLSSSLPAPVAKGSVFGVADEATLLGSEHRCINRPASCRASTLQCFNTATD